MNLEKLNLVQLNTQELKETEGGLLPLLAIVIVDAFMIGTFAGLANQAIKANK